MISKQILCVATVLLVMTPLCGMNYEKPVSNISLMYLHRGAAAGAAAVTRLLYSVYNLVAVDDSQADSASDGLDGQEEEQDSFSYESVLPLFEAVVRHSE